MCSLLLTACGGSDEATPPNQKPIVLISEGNITISENSMQTLNAVASDPDGQIVSYQWLQTTGPILTLDNTISSQLSFSAVEVEKDEIISITVRLKLTRYIASV